MTIIFPHILSVSLIKPAFHSKISNYKKWITFQKTGKRFTNILIKLKEKSVKLVDHKQYKYVCLSLHNYENAEAVEAKITLQKSTKI